MKQMHTQHEWEVLAQSLREEIQEYAWMLQLTCNLQKGVLERNSEVILELNDELSRQVSITSEKKEVRKQLQNKLAECSGLETDRGLSDLIPHLPDVCHSLFKALQKEANDLVDRLRRKVKQNERILERACDMSSDLIRLIRPEVARVKTYNSRGYATGRNALPGSVIQTAV